ncbi:urease accessory protein UreH [Peribacillus castrilensis]|uniref:Nickel/cobalt efflux system n=1 Tax=Peribacillus simplex TaxID=1478 RepID=A0AAN2TRU5_9BACI|nr:MULTISPECIES: urease accessory protein UreH [Peribacillus]MCP1097091.1 urease accessory protein UreH [Bacillaceae bacterium OS4b]MBD8588394.1 urease accessory protein UreH [Peribacillus simplex]MCP1151912.1 urease accessory protein UreH [Peribacillus frigoritolerans]MCT1386676.1 urease accessory protein UreH [Peribacillus frigoritolerans]MEA3575682.1 urease accessory protein UreH [Peribacillus frigoritolerans]
MEMSLLLVLAIGFVLGIKHALEPDHIIAVSTIASQSKKIWKSSLAGLFWGIGHTLTLLVFGVILILLKNEIPEAWTMSLEFLVGIMLVYLGITTIFSWKQTKRHDHTGRATYLKSMLVGIVHGLAGSAAMVLLTLSTIDAAWQGAIYIIIFGVGTCIGMLLFTTILSIPFVTSSSSKKVNLLLIRLTGVISTLFGIYYMYNLGINEELFSVWFG